MGNQTSVDFSEISPRPVFVKQTYDIENCPSDLDIEIIIEPDTQNKSNISHENHKQMLQRLHYAITCVHNGYYVNNSLEEIMDEIKNIPLTCKYYNREIIVLCDLVQLIIKETKQNDLRDNLIRDFIHRLMMRMMYVKTTGVKNTIELFRVLLKNNMYDHVNQMLQDIIDLPEETQKKKQFTYINKLLPEIAVEVLNITDKKHISYIESTVLKYLGLVSWETSDINDINTLGKLIFLANKINNKDLLHTLLDIVEHEVPGNRNSEDVLEILFTIAKETGFEIFNCIEKYMNVKKNFTYKSVHIFNKYMNEYRDKCVISLNKSYFYPLFDAFVNNYLPNLDPETWPIEIAYPNLDIMIYLARMMFYLKKNDSTLHETMLKLVKYSLYHIDNIETHVEILRTACMGLHVPVMKILSESNLHNMDLFGDITLSLVMYNPSYYNNDIEFVKHCIMQLMYENNCNLVKNPHKQLVHALFQIITKDNFGTFTDTAFMYLYINWHILVPNKEINRLLLEQISKMLINTQMIIKYTPLILKATEYMDKK